MIAARLTMDPHGAGSERILTANQGATVKRYGLGPAGKGDPDSATRRHSTQCGRRKQNCRQSSRHRRMFPFDLQLHQLEDCRLQMANWVPALVSLWNPYYKPPRCYCYRRSRRQRSRWGQRLRCLDDLSSRVQAAPGCIRHLSLYDVTISCCLSTRYNCNRLTH